MQSDIYKKVEEVVSLMKAGQITGYRICKDTEGRAREMSMIALKQGRAQIKNISFETALAMIEWHNKYYKDYKKGVNVQESRK